VRIANGRYHGGIELIENADLESGEIVVQVVAGRSVLKLGWSYFASITKLKARRQAVREFVSREFVLSTKPRMRVSIDGEVSEETPLHISALPDAVTIAVPRENAA
jgi:diacylglycerol kinase family enzyme